MKTGRNDPCPCGSGKKYKKCCITIDTVPQVPAEPAVDDERTKDLGASPFAWMDLGPRTHAYGVVKLVDLPFFRRGVSAHQWTPLKVAMIETQDLHRRLTALKCDLADEEVVRRIHDRFADGWRSAIHIGLEVIKERCRMLGNDDEVFVMLAYCELWKRLCPDVPSSEMIFDLVMDGYHHCGKRKHGDACARWRQAWELLQPRYTDTTATFVAADTACSDLFFHVRWVLNYMGECVEGAHENLGYAREGVAFGEAVLARFGNDDTEDWWQSVRSDVGMLYYMLGEVAKGAAVFGALMRDWPDSAGPYACWSDALAKKSPMHQPDCPAALSMVERARARNFADADRWAIKRRMMDLMDDADDTPECDGMSPRPTVHGAVPCERTRTS